MSWSAGLCCRVPPVVACERTHAYGARLLVGPDALLASRGSPGWVHATELAMGATPRGQRAGEPRGTHDAGGDCGTGTDALLRPP